PEQKQRLAGVFEDVANQAGRELRTLERHRDVLKQNLAMRRRLLALSNELPQPNQIDSMTATEARSARFTPIPAAAALTFDLAYGSDRLGCFADGMLNKETQRTDWAQKRIGRLARHTLALAADVAA